MNYIISIPHWRPATVNELLGHWTKGHRLKKRDRYLVWGIARQERIPVATGKRMVKTHVTYKPGGEFDPDNIMKSLLDALVQAGMLKDDSDNWCDWTKPTLEKGSSQVWGTRIILEDM